MEPSSSSNPPSDNDPSDLSALGRNVMGSTGGGSTAGSGGHRWQPPSAEELADLLTGYEIVKMLGRGGMGAVYMGHQTSLDRPVAIKILSSELEDTDAGFADRFQNEARAMAKLNHPGIVSVFDFGETESGMLYIVMEYVDGTDVARMIAAEGRLHTEYAMAITAHVCDALGYAHELGIIHRDIKPANIMVGYDGVVKVADFGLAKAQGGGGESVGLTQSGMVMGTMHYMAPEMVILGSKEVDQRADVYAVGVMLYHMLTGKVPHGMFELPSIQVDGMDPRYDGIIAKAMREDREARYASAGELRSDLDAILTQPVVHVEASEESGEVNAPAALPTQARPKRPGGGGKSFVFDTTPSKIRTEKAGLDKASTTKSGSWMWPTLLTILAVLVGGFWLSRPGEGVVEDQSRSDSASNESASESEPVDAPAPGNIPMPDAQSSPAHPKKITAVAPANSAVPIPQESASRPVPESNQWENLVPYFEEDSVRKMGEWRLQDGKLNGLRISGKGMIGLPTKNVSGYDLEFNVTRKGGPGGVGVAFPTPAGAASVTYTKTRKTFYFYYRGARNGESLTTVHPKVFTKQGESNVWRLEVRSDRFSLSIDGTIILDLNDIDWEKYGHQSFLFPFDEEVLGFAYNDMDVEFGSIRWRSAEDRGDAPADQEVAKKQLSLHFPVAGEWIDVLAVIDPVRDLSVRELIRGDDNTTWDKQDGELLFLDSAARGEILFPKTESIRDFELKMSFTRETGTNGLDVKIPVPGGATPVVVGIKSDNGKFERTTLKSPEKGLGIATTPYSIETGKRTTLTIIARSSGPDRGIILREGDRTLIDWKGDYRTELGVISEFQSDKLGMWIYNVGKGIETRYRFHEILFRPLRQNSKSSSSMLPDSLSTILGEWWQRMEGLGDSVYQVTVEPDGTCTLDSGGTAISGRWKPVGEELVLEWDNGVTCRFPVQDLDGEVEIMRGTLERSRADAIAVQLARDRNASFAAPAKPSVGATPELAATQKEPFENSLGMKFVPVEISGGPGDGQVLLSSIWETRVKDYDAFRKATKHPWDPPSFSQTKEDPVVNVAWEDAVAFCGWLTEHERSEGKLPSNLRYRLPTDHEWSCLAGIGGREDPEKTPIQKDNTYPTDKLRFPWGNASEPPPEFANYSGIKSDQFQKGAPVGSFPVNENGLFDIWGNADEWCADWFDPATRLTRVTRGRGWSHWGPFRRVTRRGPHYGEALENGTDEAVGFRCVLAADPEGED